MLIFPIYLVLIIIISMLIKQRTAQKYSKKINCVENVKICSGGSSNSEGTNMFTDQLLNPLLQDLIISGLAK